MHANYRRQIKPVARHARTPVLGVIAFAFLSGASQLAVAQQNADDIANHAWQARAMEHMRQMRGYPDSASSQQATPPVIADFIRDADPSGVIASFQPGGATITAQNAFFANLGTNNRTCLTCHQPADAWSVSAADVQRRFFSSRGLDPIFRLVDGATCPSALATTFDDKRKAYSLLLKKGVIRIGLPVPANAQFRVVSVTDPYNCNTNPTTGLTSIGLANPTTGIVSVYRRPLPSTNLGFGNAIMWDGREPSLAQQAIDATLGHAEGASAPTTTQLTQIVSFESGLLTAQQVDSDAGDLTALGATGGPKALVATLAAFFPGINDPLGGNPSGAPFTSKIFSLFDAWTHIGGYGDSNEDREAIARGEALFNNTSIAITGVEGLNDTLNAPVIQGFCGTCHDSPNVGNHSVKLPLNIGVANGGPNNDNPGLDIADLPVFNITCVSGPLTGRTYVVTDPGRALISGNCADIGKVKGPILRGVAARAPYFHNGSAATLADVVNFYNQRFNIGLTAGQVSDLAAFLKTL